MSSFSANHLQDPDHDPAVPLETAEQLHIESDVSLLKQAHQLEPNAVAIGTRASALALAQAYLVQAALASVSPAGHFHVTPMSTAGDKNQSTALYLLGGKSYWTKELEVALLDGAIDLIVHSLKDVPTSLPDGLELGAILKREDPRDCLVVKKGLAYRSLQDLPDGSVVGTSSVRRVAQLRRAYPKLLFADVRGNINTRLAKLDAADGPFAALILATAGLKRLDFDDRITAYLEPPDLFYAVGQGALGIEIRSNDARTRELVAQIGHWQTTWTCQAERELLRSLEGGCSVPVGACSELSDVEERADGSRSATLKLSAIIASLSGERWIEASMSRRVESIQDALTVGADVAEDLVQRGGKDILAELGRKVEDDAFRQRHEQAVKRAMDRAKQGQLNPSQDAHCGHPEGLPTSPRFASMPLPMANGHS